MERVGILLVSYGSREASIADALVRSKKYRVEIFDADKQRNPFITSVAKEVTIGIDVENIARFAEKHESRIDFGIVGPEGPIIEGVRDAVEKRTGIPMICPTKEYAIEVSKAAQRILLEKSMPKANPKFKVFDPEARSKDELKKDLGKWLDALDDKVAVKPDRPATGKGVGVWGDHFKTRKEIYEHFRSLCRHGKVIVEEKICGEEFSLQFLCDGRHLVSTPAVRDYKRAFDGDRGPNTGGMGCYRDTGSRLPFMDKKDWDAGIKIGENVFREIRGSYSKPELRGLLYMAYICAEDGLKVLEINSRPGDPEMQALMPTVKGDFVDSCFDIVDEKLKKIEFAKKAAVVTYAVPMTYGGYRKRYSGDASVDLTEAYKLSRGYNDMLRIYPGSMEVRSNGKTYACGSRAVCCVGIGSDIEAARKISLDGITSIDGALWNRGDIGSREHIQKSVDCIRGLRE